MAGAGDAQASLHATVAEGAVRGGLVLVASALVLAALGLGIYLLLADRPGVDTPGAPPPGVSSGRGRVAAVPLRRPRRVVLAFHGSAPLLAQIDGRRGPQPATARAATLKANLLRLVAAGFRTVIVDAVDTRDGGTYYFDAPSLSAAGYKQGPRLLRAIVEAAHRHELRVLAECSALTQLSPRARRRVPTAPQLRVLVRRLLELGFDGVLLRGLRKASSAALRAELQRARKHTNVAETAPFDQLLGGPLPGGGPGHRWVELDGSDPGASRNLALLRAVQFGARGFVWRQQGARWVALPELDELRDELAALTNAAPRPVVNLVLATGGGAARQPALELARGVLAPLVDAALLAGYAVQPSFDEALPGVFGYLMLALGRSAERAVEPPVALSSLLTQRKRLLLLIDGLPDTSAWRELWPRLGIKASWRPTVALARIATGDFGGRTVPWAGPRAPATRTLLLPPEALEGELLVQGRVGARTTTLVARHDRLVLVNASALAADSVFLFNGLLGGTLVAPFRGTGAVGQRSAFLAQEATTLAVRLPIAEGVKLRLTRYGPDGRRQTIEVFPYEAPLRTLLKRHELLIVEPAAR